MISPDSHPHVSIRAASPADTDVLSKLCKETFYETFAAYNSEEDMQQYLSQSFSKEAIAGEMQQPESQFIIAEVDRKAAGYARVIKNEYHQQPGNRYAIELQRLYVRQEYHGYKLGYALMQHCIAHAKMKGADALWLGVWEHNHKAINFYRKVGFVRTGEHPFVLGSDIQTDWIMELTL